MKQCTIGAGEALVRRNEDDGKLVWERADPTIHVSKSLLEQLDEAGVLFVEGTYQLRERCPDDDDLVHAYRRSWIVPKLRAWCRTVWLYVCVAAPIAVLGGWNLWRHLDIGHPLSLIAALFAAFVVAWYAGRIIYFAQRARQLRARHGVSRGADT